MSDLWEYTYLQHPSVRMDDLHEQLQAHGLNGWEMCGFASMDPTLGFNTLIAVLKRPLPSLPPPDDTTAAWLPDPSSRFELRYWNGTRWTEHVTNAGATASDPPVRNQ